MVGEVYYATLTPEEGTVVLNLQLNELRENVLLEDD